MTSQLTPGLRLKIKTPAHSSLDDLGFFHHNSRKVNLEKWHSTSGQLLSGAPWHLSLPLVRSCFILYPRSKARWFRSKSTRMTPVTLLLSPTRVTRSCSPILHYLF
ncbi:uncharacterized protein VTP21DRAFT_6365 [Calcarisporiella thermophila]|uniref:uncharacterized protein n=1 Tax=Calcarisporiella thermophila TaxID=911321 RepID=UPI003742DF70